MTLAAAETILEECLHAPEQLPDALDRVGWMLGLDYFGLVSADFEQPRYIMSERQSAALDSYFAGGWIADDYRIRGESQMPLGGLFLDHVNVENDLRRSSAVYNEFFLPNDMVNYAGIRFEIDGAPWYCAGARSEARGEITGVDASNFVRAANLAVRTISLASRVEAMRTRDLFEGLEISGAAAILLDEQGRVAAVTTAAEAMFHDAFGVREGQLWADVDKDAEALALLTQYARARLPELPRRNFLLRGHGAHPADPGQRHAGAALGPRYAAACAPAPDAYAGRHPAALAQGRALPAVRVHDGGGGRRQPVRQRPQHPGNRRRAGRRGIDHP